jgi:glyoxylase-like metal-dependent hydrolase (beta-lactamase superfamily II)
MKAKGHILSAVLIMSFAMTYSSDVYAQHPESGGARETPFAVGKVYSFDKIADGVYYAISRSPLGMRTGSSDPIIVNENGVMIVDDGMTPGAGRALLDDLKLVTDKPVRWVVNTHFHYDHTSGNSIFGPDVEIIAQESVRAALLDPEVLHREPYTGAVSRAAARIDSVKKQIADEKDPAKQGALQEELAAAQSDLEQLKGLKFTPPNVTYSSRMTLYSGQREIQLLFFGGGHTAGDTVVFLPKERIVCTGDLMEGSPKGPFVPYLGDAMFSQWITSLDDLKKLDFDTILPGHGAPFHEKSYITEVQAYLRDFITKVTALHNQGLSAEEAAAQVDLTSDKADFLNLNGPGADVRGVRRMYELLDRQQSGKGSN